jgi:hypothetical protein
LALLFLAWVTSTEMVTTVSLSSAASLFLYEKTDCGFSVVALNMAQIKTLLRYLSAANKKDDEI